MHDCVRAGWLVGYDLVRSAATDVWNMSIYVAAYCFLFRPIQPKRLWTICSLSMYAALDNDVYKNLSLRRSSSRV